MPSHSLKRFIGITSLGALALFCTQCQNRPARINSTNGLPETNFFPTDTAPEGTPEEDPVEVTPIQLSLQARPTGGSAFLSSDFAVAQGQGIDLKWTISGNPDHCETEGFSANLSEGSVSQVPVLALTTFAIACEKQGTPNVRKQIRVLVISAPASPEIRLQITTRDDLSPLTDFSFGTVEEGKSASQAFQIQNIGEGPVSAIDIESIASPFSVTTLGNNCALLSPGGACDLTVSFSPESPGSFNNKSLVFSGYDGDTRKNFSLTLSGIASVKPPPPDQCHATVALSASSYILAYPNDSTVITYESRDAPLSRIAKRNLPYVQVRNEAPSGSGIVLTEVEMEIGDARFFFGNSAIEGGNYATEATQFSNINLGSQISSDKRTLTVNLRAGLQPGEKAMFQVDIDGIEGLYAFPDFRTVFFRMNDGTFYGSNGDNLRVSAKFLRNGSAVNGRAHRLPNYEVTGSSGTYYNGRIRPSSFYDEIRVFEQSLCMPGN